MNIIVRIKNNLEYAKYRRLSNKAIKAMKKHSEDRNSIEFDKWAEVSLNSIQKCLDIPLH